MATVQILGVCPYTPMQCRANQCQTTIVSLLGCLQSHLWVVVGVHKVGVVGQPADHEGHDDEDEHLDDFLLVLLTPRPSVILLPGHFVIPKLSGEGT